VTGIRYCELSKNADLKASGLKKSVTFMVVPSGKEKSFSFTLPKNILLSLSALLGGITLIVFIFAYDYFMVIKEVYKNQYLKVENTQLKEQVQTLKIKMNSVINDIDRIQKFEKKIKVMSGIKPDGKKPFESPDQSSIEIKNLRNNNFLELRDKKNWEKEIYRRLTVPLLGIEANAEATNFKKSKKSLIELGKIIADIDIKIDEGKKIINQLELSLHEIDSLLLDQKSFFRSTPSIIPTDGWVTSHFGPRKSHYAKRIKMHEGIDIGARSGTPIVSTADGVVLFSGKKPGFGNFIKIRHGYGVETIYAHAKKLFVRAGKKVKRGELIAAVGSTGYSTGPHVHYEVRVNQVPVDPLYYILN
jgi:murein DD-endopeptidase MepM/ murein hydrolase activator NlpD